MHQIPDWKKAAAAANKSDNEIERAFAGQAHSFVADKAGPLMASPYLLGFEMQSKNEDSTRCIGLYGFRLGDELLSVPVFFLAGQIRGVELIHRGSTKMFSPFDKDWVQYLMSRVAANDQGRSFPIHDAARVRTGLRLDRLGTPPGYAKMASAEFFPADHEVCRSILPELLAEYPALLEKFASDVMSKEPLVERLLAETPDFFQRLNEELNRLEKAAAVDVMPEPVKEELVLQRGFDATKLASARFRRFGFELLDSRPLEKCARTWDDVIFEAPADTGEGFVLLADLEEKPCLWLSSGGRGPNLHREHTPNKSTTKPLFDSMRFMEAPKALMPGDGDSVPFACGSTARFEVGNRNPRRFTPLVKGSGGWRFAGTTGRSDGHTPAAYSGNALGAITGTCGVLDEYKDPKPGPVLLVNRSGAVFGALQITGVRNLTPKIRVLSYTSWGTDTDKFEVCEVSQRLDVQDAAANGVLGAGCRFLPLDPEYNNHGKLDLATLPSIDAMVRGVGTETKRARLDLSPAKSADRVVFGMTGKREIRPTFAKAASILGAGFGMTGPDIESLLDRVAEGESVRIVIEPPQRKQGATLTQIMESAEWPTSSDSEFNIEVRPSDYSQVLDSTTMIPNPKPQMRYGDRAPSTAARNPDEVPLETLLSADPQMLAQMSQSGRFPKILDHGVVGNLIDTFDSETILGKYIPALEKALDHLGRILFLFYWKPTDFEQMFGVDDMSNLENQLVSQFRSYGRFVLQLLKRHEGMGGSTPRGVA